MSAETIIQNSNMEYEWHWFISRDDDLGLNCRESECIDMEPWFISREEWV